MLHLDDEIGLGGFDFLADFFDEVGGVEAVADVDACGALGSRFVDEANENSHILLSISKLNIFFYHLILMSSCNKQKSK